jgi:putative pre-16S rRNA nuclease
MPVGVLRSIRMRALGIDYGRKRIGLALSDPTGLLARAWKTIAAAGLERQVAELAQEIEALRSDPDGLSVIVVGLPRRLSGEPNEQTALVQTVAARLAALTSLPIALQDERLSSHEAEELLARTEKDWRKRKPLLDAAAAAVILQDYLDTQPRHGAEP